MLKLYQFEACPYCEKVRLLLDYKQLPYEKIEIIPGVGQLDLWQKSGQMQVPVLQDGDEWVPDSTAIARYLDATYPDRPLLPIDAQQRGLCLALEDWADTSLGANSRIVMMAAWVQHPNVRTAALPNTTPDWLKSMVGALPGEFASLLGSSLGMIRPDPVKTAQLTVKQALESLCLMLRDHAYLCGEQPTLADFAVAGMTLALKVPGQQYVELPAGLCGQGIPGLADDVNYQAFFDWRDRLYTDYRQRRDDIGGDDIS
ncbi:MAG: glutathione S-transferase family protein [Cyanobacteria bacterium]|nr:glutathione S-transferase family protein [Cyanobacteriota bacterium]MDA0865777.1 glutathione S-transferase family protein [Cyanobacteriota bacterium]